jgi:hypothetical protein
MNESGGDTVHDGMIQAQARKSDSSTPGLGRAIPAALETRYLRDANRLLFPDRAPAIEDRGERLIALTGNSQVAADLVAIAQARGWSRISSHGSEPFRLEIRRAAGRLGIEVVNDAQARAGVNRRPEAQETPTVEIPHGAPAGSATPYRADTARNTRASRPKTPTARRPGDTITGRLVESGEAPYRFNPANTRSFYVRVQTASGVRDIWGTELRRALSESPDVPKPGDSIAVRFLGTAPGSKDGAATNGRSTPARARNLWRIEKTEVVERRRAEAASIRSTHGSAITGSDRGTVLRDASAILRAAELFASSRISVASDRGRFVEAVRQTLAATVERGDQIPAVRLRSKATAPAPNRSSPGPQRELPLAR